MAFEFIRQDLGPDADLLLTLRECQEAKASPWGVPAYTFAMTHAQDGHTMGRIRLRVGWNEQIIRYAGQVGYAVDEAFRGHRYARRAVRLILPLARHHGLEELWITCQPDNVPSRRTLEGLGAELAGVFDVPKDYPLDAGVERRKACFRLRTV